MYIALGIVFFFVIVYTLYIFNLFSNEADAKKNLVYPPWINACPDYWKQTTDDSGNKVCQRDSNNPTGSATCDSGACSIQGGMFNLNNLDKDDLKTFSSDCSLPWEGINDP